ncbi:MAG: phage portal protein [Actinomyces urogenitalis]|uniref:phage portal protein n=1 Tax=Actinomyces urogenitalis TaxID=103621 RepID=UPI0039936389
MGILQRAVKLLTRDATTGALATQYPGIIPPARGPHGTDPRSLAAVYRGIQVLTTAAMQMPLTVERWGARMTSTPSLIAQPDPHMPASQWIAHMVTSLVMTGNAYARATRNQAGDVLALLPLNPQHVFLTVDPTTRALRFSIDGATVPAADVLHAHLQPATPSEPVGLGPIQAARAELDGARQVRDFATQWFDGTGEPTGILSSPNATYAEAIATRNAWNGLDADGNQADPTPNPSRVKVLPTGFTYQPLNISPKDAQWIEAQEFNTVQIARLLGIPASLMMVNPSGGSTTYANVQDEWLNFIRFTLMAYLRPLEDALTAFTPGGQTVRFNLDSLMRPATKARYDAHAVGIGAGFLTVNEARALEGRPPLPPESEEQA